MKDTLTPNEWIVMNALWEKSPLSLSEVIQRIGGRADWNYKTYQSYILILEKKGMISAEKRGRDKLYSPAISKAECVETEKKSLLGKLERDAVGMLIAGMVQDSDLSATSYRELKNLLDELIRQEEA